MQEKEALQSFIEKLKDLSTKQKKEIISYLDNNIPFEDLSSDLQRKVWPSGYRKDFATMHKQLLTMEDREYAGRYYLILLLICQRFHQSFWKGDDHYKTHENRLEFLEKVDPRENFKAHYFKRWALDFFDTHKLIAEVGSIYSTYSKELEEAVELTNRDLKLATALILQDPEKYQPIVDQLSETYLSYLTTNNFYTKNPLEIERVKDLWNNAEPELSTVAPVLSGLTLTYPYYHFKIQVIVANILWKYSKVVHHFLLFAWHYNAENTLQEILNDREKEYLPTAHNLHNASIPYAHILATTVTSRSLVQYHWDDIEEPLEKLSETNEADFQEAIKLVQSTEQAKLIQFLSNQDCSDLEEKAIETFVFAAPPSIQNEASQYGNGTLTLPEFAHYMAQWERLDHSYKNRLKDLIKGLKRLKSPVAITLSKALSLLGYLYDADDFSDDILGEAETIKTLKEAFPEKGEEFHKQIVKFSGRFPLKGIKKLIKDEADRELLIAEIVKLDADDRVDTINSLINKNIYPDALIAAFIGDGSKAVRDEVKRSCTKNANLTIFKEMIPTLLEDKKSSTRQTTVELIVDLNLKEFKELLQERFKKERSKKIKEAIASYCQLELPSVKEKEEKEAVIVPSSDGAYNDLEEYTKTVLKGFRKQLPLDLETLPQLLYKDGITPTPPDVSKAILASASRNSDISITSDIEIMVAELDKPTLANWALTVLEGWLKSGAQAKWKYCMVVATILGDARILHKLQPLIIKTWPRSSRTAIAGDTLIALAVNGGSEQLMFVDQMTHNYKYMSINEKAVTAFQNVAQKRNITPDELSDEVVPNLSLTIDYGPRSFALSLTLENEIVITTDTGKVVKSLPKGGANDDAQKVTLAKEHLKMLKKSIKEIIAMQQKRLELALTTSRSWKGENWKKLFMQNPLMLSFAVGLIWKTGDTTFRYTDEGGFTTADDEPFELPEEATIQLAHPLTISADEKRKWQEQLDDYEITPPFDQLNRALFLPTEHLTEDNFVNTFGGYRVYGGSLSNQLRTMGWTRGEIGDGGGYYTFHRSVSGVDYTLFHSGLAVSYEDDDTTILAIKVEGIPKEQHFSEILYSIDKAIGEKGDKDPKWEETFSDVERWASY